MVGEGKSLRQGTIKLAYLSWKTYTKNSFTPLRVSTSLSEQRYIRHSWLIINFRPGRALVLSPGSCPQDTLPQGKEGLFPQPCCLSLHHVYNLQSLVQLKTDPLLWGSRRRERTQRLRNQKNMKEQRWAARTKRNDSLEGGGEGKGRRENNFQNEIHYWFFFPHSFALLLLLFLSEKEKRKLLLFFMGFYYTAKFTCLPQRICSTAEENKHY